VEQLSTDYPPPEGPRRAQGIPRWPAVVVAIIALGGLTWYFWGRRQPEPLVELPVASSRAPVAEETPEAVPAEPWDVPSLAESDDFLRDVAARLSSHPEWLQWIATEELVHRFVAAVDEVARGEVPKAQIAFLSPKQDFSAIGGDSAGVFAMAPDSYRRFSRLTAVVSGLDARGAVALFRRLEPLLTETYRELGYPDGNFESRLVKAGQVVLATPSVDGPIRLTPAVRSYKFVDPELEGLLPIQKLMLRLGPQNLEAVKSKIRTLVRELEGSEAQL